MNTLSETLFLTEDQRWNAVQHHSPEAEGLFYFAVKTTGVYCRPTCSSRSPRRENVVFFTTWEAAEQAGFRACKRCQPKENLEETANYKTIIAACNTIDRADDQPSLESLAQEAGLSIFYFQRLFKKIVGVSPKQYFLEKRANRIRQNLLENERVTDAVYNSGYGSTSRFYSQAADTLGMKPLEYRRGGKGLHIAYAVSPCYLGHVLVAATEMGVCAIYFGDDPESLEQKLAQQFPGAELAQGDVHFTDWVKSILSFLESPANGLDLPLDIMGTAFQRRVWMALRTIPSGSTASYADVAQKIGSPKAVRAVAQACATNQIAVAIPCHRVVRSNGELGGYRWGIERKRKLLEHEHAKLAK